MTPKVKLTITAAVIVLLAAAVLLIVRARSGPEAVQYSEFYSPGGEYRIVTYGYLSSAAVMPGQGGDRAGFVRVYDARGTLYCQIDIPMVNTMYESAVRWSANSVAIPSAEGFTRCPLP